MKGIILAGGHGTRLYPATLGISKQLLPIYDKPMIYYPLGVLMLAGIRDILIISTPRDLPLFQHLLGNGHHYGLNFSYKQQDEPKGLAEAFIIAEDFIENERVALILGDNLFFGHNLYEYLQQAKQQVHGATIFAYQVENPERYGVISFDPKTGDIQSIVEKDPEPKSNWAITGLYFYDQNIVDYSKSLKPSARGELEITDIHRLYWQNNALKVFCLGRGFAWLDTGTHDSLHDASSFVRTIEKRQGIKVMCPEEIAFQLGYINKEDVLRRANQLGQTDYATYLKHRVVEIKND